MIRWIQLLMLACIGGLLGHWAGIPVGALLGALLFVAVYQVMTHKLPVIPANAKRAIQMLLGANIGLAFSSETVAVMKSIWLPALLIPLLQLSIGVIIGLILIRFLKIDIATAFCCSVPAGMSEIAFLAETYKASLPLVVTVHICRVFFLVFTIPFIIYLIL
ncbi:AbrB family transcriptional regulator [Desertibacillus haloalkaliphilus]|uniref:AbrB family transcriptional regulator n=1 Tax=Desertibacillus haloalkaliphilus TaxID=1328930 RepID=UPI001C278931|nr:AbrB family transcriptional regulator [Desertibacillus haloalkaliphilus]MBU8906003.1 AbrB family transcriptional regulator [Desertibacillus haloalkaliphilus]